MIRRTIFSNVLDRIRPRDNSLGELPIQAYSTPNSKRRGCSIEEIVRKLSQREQLVLGREAKDLMSAWKKYSRSSSQKFTMVNVLPQ